MKKDALGRTPEQIRQDEEILAKIIAGGAISGRKVLPHSDKRDGGVSFSGHLYGSDDEPDGPCCAIGAGIAYAGWKIGDDPQRRFSAIHRVSLRYAQSVSDGFEGSLILNRSELPNWSDVEYTEYLRGFGVGRAAYDALVQR